MRRKYICRAKLRQCNARENALQTSLSCGACLCKAACQKNRYFALLGRSGSVRCGKILVLTGGVNRNGTGWQLVAKVGGNIFKDFRNANELGFFGRLNGRGVVKPAVQCLPG